jgi:phosphoglycolate phosphatase
MKIHNDCSAAMLDLDGTLVDTLDDFVAALNLMLDELALPRVAAPQVAGLIGKGGEFLVRSVLAQLSKGEAVGAGQAETALARFRHHYERVNGRHARVFPGVLEGL